MNKIFSLSILLTSSAALAAGGAGHHAPHVSNWWELTGHMDDPAVGWMMVTFVIFVALLVRFVRKPLNAHLASRADEVKTALKEAADAKAEAEKKAREYEDRLATLDDEIAALKKDFTSRGEAELRRLEENGKAQAARVLKDAEDTIQAEVERAQQDLKEEAGRLALEIAEQRIKDGLKADDHKRLSDRFLDDIAA